MEHKESKIQKIFEGQTILLTGVTGSLGKLILEKLLRSCSKIKMVYVVVRTKKGKTPEERLDEMFNVAAFEELHMYNFDYRKQVKMMQCDMMEEHCGISASDRQILIDEVTLVIHSAATVRFDFPLKTAIINNTRATKYMLELAKQMKHLKCFTHISTAFSFCNRHEVDEKFYDDLPMSGLESIKMVETMDEDLLVQKTKE